MDLKKQAELQMLRYNFNELEKALVREVVAFSPHCAGKILRKMIDKKRNNQPKLKGG